MQFSRADLHETYSFPFANHCLELTQPFLPSLRVLPSFFPDTQIFYFFHDILISLEYKQKPTDLRFLRIFYSTLPHRNINKGTLNLHILGNDYREKYKASLSKGVCRRNQTMPLLPPLNKNTP